MNKEFDLHYKYHKRAAKRKAGKPAVIQIIMERTFNSAYWILDTIKDIEFTKLIFNVYYVCKDISFREIVKLYDAQLELAGIDPDKFVFGLHRFYTSVSKKMRKEGKFREFAEFAGAVMRMKDEKRDELDERVIDAYLSLVMQTLEYIRKDQFDLTQCTYGISTDGELLVGKYPYPYSDLPATEYQEIVYSGKAPKTKVENLLLMRKIYKKYGFEINSLEDLHILETTQRTHVNTMMALFPFINEFTFDIVPQDCYNTIFAPLAGMICLLSNLDILKDKLRHRNRTLPINGVEFKIDDAPGELKRVLLKEVLYNDRVHLLYRIDTINGDVAGYYDTSSKYFYSVTRDVNIPGPLRNITALILTLYATQVLSNISIKNVSKLFINGGKPLEIKAYGSGGKLKNVYQREKGYGMVRDLSHYEKEDRHINVIIRKLPEGQQASEEAKALAAQYGYELEEGQTFVRPFIKQVFIGKDRKSEIKPEENN